MLPVKTSRPSYFNPSQSPEPTASSSPPKRTSRSRLSQEILRDTIAEQTVFSHAFDPTLEGVKHEEQEKFILEPDVPVSRVNAKLENLIENHKLSPSLLRPRTPSGGSDTAISPELGAVIEGRETSPMSDISPATHHSPLSTKIGVRIYALAMVHQDTHQNDKLVRTMVKDSLGEQSKSWANVKFEDGGGCIIEYRKSERKSMEKLQKALEKRQARWDAAVAEVREADLHPQHLTNREKRKLAEKRSSIAPPNRRPATIADLNDATVMDTTVRKIELHPYAGIHNSYRQPHTPRGSYVRIQTDSGQNRFGRHGTFESNQLYNGQNLIFGKPDGAFKAKVPTGLNEQMPSPNCADLVMDTLFHASKNQVLDLFSVLANDSMDWDEIEAECSALRESMDQEQEENRD
ncbi:MAG: hypothetical protein ACRYGK_02535 [Janthinobacterium lividum]